MRFAALSDWTEADIRQGLRIADDFVVKATGLDSFSRLNFAERRLRDTLAGRHARIAKPGDKWLVKKMSALGDKATQKDIDRLVDDYTTRWAGYSAAVNADIGDVIELGQELGRTAIYRRAFGAPRETAVYNGPPYQDRAPKATVSASGNVSVQKAADPTLAINPTFSLADRQALAQLKKTQLFWMGEYHSKTFNKQVKNLAGKVILEQGLPREEAGRRLGQSLGHLNGYKVVKPIAPIPTGWSGPARQYFDIVAANAASVGRIQSQLSAMSELGFNVYEVLNPVDERTCPVCEAMNGAVLDVKRAFARTTDVAAAATPEAVKELHPWLSEKQFLSQMPAHKVQADGSKQFSKAGQDKLVDNGTGYPPFHARCRCSVDIRPETVTTPITVPASVKIPPGLKPVGPAPKPGVNPIGSRKSLSTSRGNATPLDAGDIENQSVLWRLEEIEGADTIAARFQLTQHGAEKAAIELDRLKAKKSLFRFRQAQKRSPGDTGKLKFGKKRKLIDPDWEEEFEMASRVLKRGKVRVEVVGSREGAMGNHVVIRYTGSSPEKAWKEITKVMRELGIKDPTTVPTAEAQELLAKARLITLHAPKPAIQLRLAAIEDLSAIDDIWAEAVKTRPYMKDLLKDMTRREVAPGHQALYSAKQAKMAIDEGVTHIFHDMDGAGRLADVLKNGLLSSRNRYGRGLFQRGASTTDDFGSGGAGSVFTRVGFGKKPVGARGSTAFHGESTIRVVIDPKQLGRTDWYAYDFDAIGATTSDTIPSRVVLREFKTRMKANLVDNEVMFEHGVGPDAIQAIVVPSDRRAAIIKSLKRDGVTKVGKRRVEDLIVSEYKPQ